MKNELIELEIHDIECALRRDDPAFVRKFRALDRSDGRHEAAVVSLLVASAVLLAVGLATLAPIAWLTGAVAFVAAALVDARHERRLGMLHEPARGD